MSAVVAHTQPTSSVSPSESASESADVASSMSPESFNKKILEATAYILAHIMKDRGLTQTSLDALMTQGIPIWPSERYAEYVRLAERLNTIEIALESQLRVWQVYHLAACGYPFSGTSE